LPRPFNGGKSASSTKDAGGIISKKNEIKLSLFADDIENRKDSSKKTTMGHKLIQQSGRIQN